MPNGYNSEFTGLHNDEYDDRIIALDSRITTLENISSALVDASNITASTWRTKLGLTDTNLFNILYPVGTIVCKSTSGAPSSIGTWTCVEKRLAYISVDAFTPTLNSTNCTTASVQGWAYNHHIHLYMTFTNKVAITDSSLEMFTISPSKFGCSSFGGGARKIAWFTDGGNAIINMTLSTAGVCTTVDVLIRNNTAANLAAGTSISAWTVDFDVPDSALNTANCDRFFYKRTA